LLTVVFRSIVVALKAILMNLLSVGAAYGLLVLVFQEGVGAGVLGFRQAEAIADWIPLFLFSVLFGLSMDYHVFLLTRIREQFDRTHDNAGSVAYGLRTTAGIITGAALIMVAVFAGFASGELVMFQQVGFGLGVAVLLDATIVRTVLVPASMKLLGTRNWYLPRWLRWLPELHTEDTHEPTAPTTAPTRSPVAAAHGDDRGDGEPGRRDLPGVFGLDDEAATDPSQAGHKAATLARLSGLGFPVPPGVVVSVEAIDRIRARGTVPEDLHDQLAVALGGLGGGPVAVRSSGSAEDLPGASFAGQYETVLDVDGIDAVEQAVMRCATSVRAERVTAYVAGRVTSAGSAAPHMAVLVQAMVRADAAGVAFTADPVTGDRDEVLVSAVRGLGERLVGGEATPEEWRVRSGEARRLAGPERVIDAEQAARVAALSAAVEAALGGPQDVEWAIAGSGLSLVQARPITALPHPPPIVPPAEGFWEKDDEHYPMPLTPFGASVYLPAIEHGLAAMLDRWGLPAEARLRSLGGEVYSRMVPLGGRERRPPPWWVVWVAMRAVPPLRRRARRIDRALRDRLPDRLIDGWSAGREGFRRDAAALRTVDLRRLTDLELLEHMDRVLALLRRGEAAHFELLPAYVIAVYELGKTCEEVLGWTPAEALALLAGNSETSSEPGRALRDLAAAMAASPAAVAALEGAGDDLVDRLRVQAPEIAVLVESYLAEHGHRTFSYDPGDPTLADRPGLVATLLRARVADGGTRPDHAAEARTAALARATDALRSRPREQAERFHDALDTAERAYGTREDNVLWTDNVPSGLLRDVATEAGRRLAERGTIARADDAVYLQDIELRAALLGDSPDLRPLVDERRAERAWVTAHPGPDSYGRPSVQPGDLRGLPTGLRYLSAAMAWYLGLRATRDRAEGGASTLSGVAGSPGRHTGTVRVIRDESEFGRLGPGEVLVCPITSPAWSLLFVQAGALVTDGGGLLAHAAVIAREYGVPAVLATGDATRRLHDGDTVTVDGTAGAVYPTAGLSADTSGPRAVGVKGGGLPAAPARGGLS
ncbi:MAG TPA: PEP/pyruvate-binding domain-containing protein, partial [Acidimicrobiales bacterium]